MSKQPNLSKWVSLANLKDIKANARQKERRPALFKVWTQGGKSLAADGYRMHYVDAILPEAIPATPSAEVPDFLSLIPTNREGCVSVSTWALVQALQACKPFARDSSNISRWSVNGSLDLASTSAEYGDCTVSIRNGDMWAVKQSNKVKQIKVVYQHTGPDIDFGLNVKFALDALSGMGEQTTIWYQYAHKPIVLTSGICSALICPMHISR